MTSVIKNKDYILHHIDDETGFGLLYSHKYNKSIIINSLATVLWKIPADTIEPVEISRLFAEKSKIPNASEYFLKIISELTEQGLLISDDRDPQVNNVNSTELENDNYKLGQIYFYATNECNARCYHCYQQTTKVKSNRQQHKETQISKDAFLKLVKDALPLGLKRVKITGGELLLRSDIEDIIIGIREQGIGVAIETNGFLIDEALADLFVEQKVDVSISLDGGSPELHDSLRGLPGSFERATRALKMLADRGYAPKIIMAVSHKNLHDIENTVRVAAKNGCRLVKINPVSNVGSSKALSSKNILLTVEDIMALNKLRKDIEKKYGVFLFIEGPPAFVSIYEMINGYAAACPFTEILSVLPDGSLSFCGVGNICSELILGKIDDKDFELKTFWQESNRLTQVRQLLTQKIEGVCKMCVLEDFCKGSCRACAYEKSKSFLAPHPWCQSAYEKDNFPFYYLVRQ